MLDDKRNEKRRPAANRAAKIGRASYNDSIADRAFAVTFVLALILNVILLVGGAR